MFAQLRSVVLMFVLLTVITGVAYPLLVTVVAQIVFPYQANGSLIIRDGKLVGSELIGQTFDDPKYFWGRPSATSAFPDNASASSGSNLGPTNPAQFDAVRSRIDAIKKVQPESTAPIPIDLVTASASGLDPQVSPAAAEYQVARVANARGLSYEQVRKLVAQNTDDRTFGLLGEPRVNVLKLNLALDDLRSTQ
ncbi:MAG TPA: potassium-transporting ATPase subunit KdpC [Lacipirellulaceae bacterium]|jgi:K+-transporting ATPase ATPase C chain